MVKDDSKMNDTKLTRAGSVKPKLSPRRDFGPAQDFPRRQYSLKATSGSNPGARPNLRGIRKKRATTSAEDVLITILSPKVILLYRIFFPLRHSLVSIQRLSLV